MVSKVVHASSKTGGKDNWQTPEQFFQALDARWHFDIDAAADETNHLCPTWFGPGGSRSSRGSEDALTTSWGPWQPIVAAPDYVDEAENEKVRQMMEPRPAHVYCNPPYSRVSEFVKKASEESSLNYCTAVVLVPARTDTKWFHAHVYDEFTGGWRPHVSVVFVKGRIKFIDPKPKDATKKPAGAPFPSMLVFFHAHNASRPIL